MEEKIDRVLALLEENNLMLKRLVDKLDTVESEDYQTKRTLDEFVNNVVSNWFADKVLDIEKYDWHILLFLDYSCDYLDEVLDAMDKLKCGSKSYDIAYDNLSSCSVNTGLTFSDYISRTSVIVISITNSEKEFLKSYHHELGHCAVHICQFYGIPLEGEEVQYLGQDLVDRTWDIAKIFLCDCDCCKNKRNEKKRDFEGNESHEK